MNTRRRLLTFPLWIGLFLIWAGLLAAEKDVVRVLEVEKDHKIYFYAVNHDLLAPYHEEFTFPQLNNIKFSASLPVSCVIPPNKKILLGWLSPIASTLGYSYKAQNNYGFGDPQRVPDASATYLFPYQHGVKHGVTQGYFGKITHQICYCLDFDLAEGSPVCAARGGTVVQIKQDSNVGGFSPDFGRDGNYVRVLHSDGTWANYCHIQHNGAKVKLGQKVTAGQVIALSGHTGQAQGPHLHFEVKRGTWRMEEESIPTKFLIQGRQLVDPVEGKFYYSYHPGGPAFKQVTADSISETELDQYLATAPPGNAVTLRTEKIDTKVFFYVSNPTPKDKWVTLNFPVLSNMTPSKLVPLVKRVPAGKEVYFLSLSPLSLDAPCNYSCSLSWRAKAE